MSKTTELVERLRELPRDTRKATMEIYDLCVEASYKIEELVDRCARYAEEIAVLRERQRWIPVTERLPEEIDMDHEAAEQLRQLCEGYDLGRLAGLAEADKDGRVVVRPCKGLSTKPDDGRQIGLEQAIAHLEGLLRDHDFECEDCKRDHRELLELLVELKERRDDNG